MSTSEQAKEDVLPAVTHVLKVTPPIVRAISEQLPAVKLDPGDAQPSDVVLSLVEEEKGSEQRNRQPQSLVVHPEIQLQVMPGTDVHDYEVCNGDPTKFGAESTQNLAANGAQQHTQVLDLLMPQPQAAAAQNEFTEQEEACLSAYLKWCRHFNIFCGTYFLVCITNSIAALVSTRSCATSFDLPQLLLSVSVGVIVLNFAARLMIGNHIARLRKQLTTRAYVTNTEMFERLQFLAHKAQTAHYFFEKIDNMGAIEENAIACRCASVLSLLQHSGNTAMTLISLGYDYKACNLWLFVSIIYNSTPTILFLLFYALIMSVYLFYIITVPFYFLFKYITTRSKKRKREAYLERLRGRPYAELQSQIQSNECAICLQNYADDEAVAIVCARKHHFHEACVRLWLAENHDCPYCREKIV